MAKEVVLTPEGLKKLEDELEYLKVTGRKEIAEKIKIARGFGDLSENAEYDSAKEAQASMEERISKIEEMLKNDTNDVKIEWLTNKKAMWRFMTAAFNKRNLYFTNASTL